MVKQLLEYSPNLGFNSCFVDLAVGPGYFTVIMTGSTIYTKCKAVKDEKAKAKTKSKSLKTVDLNHYI